MFSVDARLAARPARDRRQVFAPSSMGCSRCQAPGRPCPREPVSDNRYYVTGVSEIGDKVLAPEPRVRFAFNNVAPAIRELRVKYRGRDLTPTIATRESRDISHAWTALYGIAVGQSLGAGQAPSRSRGVSDRPVCQLRDCRAKSCIPALPQQGNEGCRKFEMGCGPASEVCPGAKRGARRSARRCSASPTRRKTEDSSPASEAALLASYSAIRGLLA